MKTKSIIAPGIAVICSTVISSGYASSDKKEDTLVVTASGFTQQLRNAPASVSVITSEQLQKKPVSDLVDAVKDVEGISITGGNEKPDISIRGLSGDYTLILVDGRRQSGRESGCRW